MMEWRHQWIRPARTQTVPLQSLEIILDPPIPHSWNGRRLLSNLWLARMGRRNAYFRKANDATKITANENHSTSFFNRLFTSVFGSMSEVSIRIESVCSDRTRLLGLLEPPFNKKTPSDEIVAYRLACSLLCFIDTIFITQWNSWKIYLWIATVQKNENDNCFLAGSLAQRNFSFFIFQPVIRQNDVCLLDEWTIMCFAARES